MIEALLFGMVNFNFKKKQEAVEIKRKVDFKRYLANKDN